ncbi:hypothetical protein SEA_CECE_299 [Microbacterium phage Cece]|nr:hypothetical protein SEA_CECE_299 [Microbacterium phage Cece]
MTNPVVMRASTLLPSLDDSNTVSSQKNELAAEAIRELISEVKYLEAKVSRVESFNEVVFPPEAVAVKWDDGMGRRIRAAHAAKTKPWYERLGAWLSGKFS